MRIIITALAATLAAATSASAQSPGISGDVVKIGVLNDRSSFQSDLAGVGSEVAARIAAAEVGNKVLGKPVEIIAADMQNKPDVATSIARSWFDTDGVDMIADNQLSSAALAVQELAKQRGKITISVSSATTRLNGDSCSPTGFKWSYDTHSAAAATASAVVKQGGKDWFFLTSDYTFGHTLEEQTSKVVVDLGGRVLGAARHPMGSSDFGSYLLTAQASGAKIIGLANGGTDTINSVKQGREFGLTAGGDVSFAGLAMFITDIHGIGLEAAQGMLLSTSFYWDRDEKSREFAKKFAAEMGRMPTMVHAGVYSGVRHYLRAVEAAGTDDGPTVAAKMKELPVDDLTIQGARIPQNGRVFHDMYLVRVKKPEESTGPWDYYDVIATIPAKDAFLSFEESGCKL
ncbi:ABC transporter substrate-binding protein [Propylenella binzhouense]|uniref:ABC transporter substrate-binding protein n=1 Tax=Propylenella binzhouense TaxID=2555902 RepID=A0A964T184_9HYPH|nr:ABC transporter substrate-binding protein [Propylenella binzhouense]MYZ46556.1 ABC transporter substrate-binding protein [Propylenella binzhouense]